MPSLSWKLLVCALILPCLSLLGWAELMNRSAAPLVPGIRSQAARAGYIFDGTVESVEAIAPGSSNAIPVMRITFRVRTAIRGVRAGQRLVIRECAGLWEAGEQYRPGERLMLFLYPLSKLGLTSSVGGSLGRLVVGTNGRIEVNPDRYRTPRQAPLKPGTLPPIWITPRELAWKLQLRGEE